MLELEDPSSIGYANRPHDVLTNKIIGAAIAVHRVLGPGLFESSYEACLIYELQQMSLNVECQKVIPLIYKEIKLDCGYRLDLLVEQKVVVEIKSVSELVQIYDAQLITYLKLSGYQVGLLINFNTKILKQGIRRIIV
jgi:GxxExxY protein